MEVVLNLPLDVESWPEYRMLKAEVGGDDGAAHTILFLFTELGYSAKAGNPLAILGEKEKKLLLNKLGPEEEKRFQALVISGLLKTAENGLFCPRFKSYNAHLDSGYTPPHMRGNHKSVVVRQQNAAKRQAIEQSLFIPIESFQRSDGSPMTSQERQDVMVFIRGCDQVIGRQAERPMDQTGFPLSVVQNAWQMLQKYNPDQIRTILAKFREFRSHLPSDTDRLLGMGSTNRIAFEEFAEALMKAA